MDTYLGARLRSLRRRANLSQVRLAEQLGISPSYLNLIEHDRRRFPAELMFKAAAALDVDVREFAVDDRGSLLQELMEALGDPDLDHPEVKAVDARTWVQAQPQLAAAFVEVWRKWKSAQDDVDKLGAVSADGHAVDQGRLPSEEVNDLIARRMNHFEDVETVAELFWRRYDLSTPQLFDGLSRILQKSFRIDVRVAPTRAARGVVRHYDPERRLLTVSESVPTRSRSFQLAHQIGLLALGHVFEDVVKDPLLTTDESRKLGRLVLANYFAGAMLMPYERFWEAAESERYDIEVLGSRFRASFEQVCHRLTTLRRRGMEGVPFHLVKVDIAGNVSKRFNGSGLPFVRFGGGCPRWAVHGAFMSPGRFRVQVSELPDGSRWFDVARTVTRRQGAWSEPESVHAIGLGCRIEHAHRLTYADGLDLTKPELVPIGINCRVCERQDCHQRAYPSVKHPMAIDENVRRLAFYASAGGDGDE